jgi:enediyne biosynthesis thioesterase
MSTIASNRTLFPRVTFQDTNVVGNVYFLTYFRWQFECFDEWFRYSFPARWRAFRHSDKTDLISSCSLRFDDPFGATIGDEIRVSGLAEEQLDGSVVMSTELDKLVDIESVPIASGSMTWNPEDGQIATSVKKPVGPCYTVSMPVPGGWKINPIDLLSWQGKCRELFLADHAPEMLRLVAERKLALQTSSASAAITNIPLHPVEEVRVELRLENIKCGQMGVRFDYFAESALGAVQIAEGTQRMSCKKWNGSSLVPCVFQKDLLKALGRFTQSDRIRRMIDDILEFLEGSNTCVDSPALNNR